MWLIGVVIKTIGNHSLADKLSKNTKHLPGLLKLAGDGSHVQYSTRIAGTGDVHALAVDVSGNVYLAGTAKDGYPTTPGAVQTVCSCARGPSILQNGFATKVAADGRTIIYSTYLSHGFFDRAWVVVPDGDGNVYVGGTNLWKLSPTGSLVWAKDFSPGEFFAVTLASNGDLYTAGATWGPGLYTSANAFQKLSLGASSGAPQFPASSDAFAAKFRPAGDVLYSTLLSGRGWQAALAIVADEQGTATVAGYAVEPRDFPTRFPFQAALDSNSGFLAKFNPDGSNLLYSTYVGDASGVSGVVLLAQQPSGELALVESTNDGRIVVENVSETNSPPPIHVDSVLNEANLYGGPVSPGEWVVLRGSGFGPDSRALLGDLPLFIQSVSAAEILARVPETFQAIGATTLHVESGGQSSPSLRMNVEPTSPAIFTQDGSGDGPALAFNDDGRLNTADHPAAKGSQIAIAVNGIPAGVLVRVSFDGAAETVLTSVQTAPVPGLPGDSYSILVVTLPNDTYSPPDGNADFSLLIDERRVAD